MKGKFEKWVRYINNIRKEFPRSIPLKQEFFTTTDLHVSSDASIIANCVVVSALV